MPIKIKRIYETYESDDGWRILIDRFWPRGMTKEQAHLDEWLKELAPSKKLIAWFHHEPDKFDDFVRKYREELNQNLAARKFFKQILEKSAHNQVTLLYSAKDSEHNQAVVLKEYLEEMISTR